MEHFSPIFADKDVHEIGGERVNGKSRKDQWRIFLAPRKRMKSRQNNEILSRYKVDV